MILDWERGTEAHRDYDIIQTNLLVTMSHKANLFGPNLTSPNLFAQFYILGTSKVIQVNLTIFLEHLSGASPWQ